MSLSSLIAPISSNHLTDINFQGGVRIALQTSGLFTSFPPCFIYSEFTCDFTNLGNG